jgi:simple sugar transport system substrate-binding protein
LASPASADEAEQVRLIQDAISRKVNAILVVPNNAQSLEPVFAQAKEAGIVVLTHESPDQKNANFDIEMINNQEFGEYAAEQLAKNMGGKASLLSSWGRSPCRHTTFGPTPPSSGSRKSIRI